MFTILFSKSNRLLLSLPISNPPPPKFLKLYMVLAEVSAFGRLLPTDPGKSLVNRQEEQEQEGQIGRCPA